VQRLRRRSLGVPRTSHRRAAFAAALPTFVLGVAVASASTPDTSTMTDDFVGLLTFVGGTPLAEPERRRY
jgi:hypothetical protein